MDWCEPRLLLQTAPTEFTEEEFREYLRCARAFANNVNGPFAVVTDLSRLRASSVDALTRSRYADHQRAVAAIDHEYCAGAAIVTKNALQRGVITAVFWLSPPVYPYAVVSDLRSALAFSREALVKAVAAAERLSA